MRLRQAFLFQINREICSNSSTVIKPFKDEALIVPNFRQMLFLVSCLMGRRKIETVAFKCLPLTLLSARNAWCLESGLRVSSRLNPSWLSDKKCYLPLKVVWKQLRQGHGLLRQYLYWGWLLVTLDRINNHRNAPDWQWKNLLTHWAGCKCIFSLLYKEYKY